MATACSHLVEEHVTAEEGRITFDRVAGRKTATNGISINKDSISIKPL